MLGTEIRHYGLYATFSPLLRRFAITFLIALMADTGVLLVGPVASLRLFFPLWGALIIGWPYLSRKLAVDVPNGGDMQRISTPYMAAIKIGPFVFFGFLGLLLFLLLANGAYETSPILLVGVGVMAVYGVCSMLTSRQDCVDDVFDCGDHLLVKKSGQEDTVPLSNIFEVTVTVLPSLRAMGEPPRSARTQLPVILAVSSEVDELVSV